MGINVNDLQPLGADLLSGSESIMGDLRVLSEEELRLSGGGGKGGKGKGKGKDKGKSSQFDRVVLFTDPDLAKRFGNLIKLFETLSVGSRVSKASCVIVTHLPE